MRYLLSILIGLLLCVPDAGAEAGPAPPHLVIFISDDHGYLDSSVTGSKDVATPNMDRLAREGLTFTHMFTASPTCAPSRAAMLTGFVPLHNGSMINHQPARDEVRKLPHYMHQLGYEVVSIGKVAHYHQGGSYGFDLLEFDGFHQDQCVDRAVQYLNDRDGDKPLCLLVGTNWPHVPWPEDPRNRDVSQLTLPPTHVDTEATRQWRAKYYAAVERADSDLGKVYDAAYAKLGKNTAFIHFSDHGGQWPFGKWNLYDAGIRVPFYVVWPGVVKPGSAYDGMEMLIDVLPSLIEMGGGDPTSAADFDGRSLMDVLRGKRQEGRPQVITTHSGDTRINSYPMRAIRTERWKYVRNLRPDAEYHTHIDRAKPVDGSDYFNTWINKAKKYPQAKAKVDRYYRRPAEELYDVQNDPHEQHNLLAGPNAAEHQSTRDELSQKLDEAMEQIGDRGLATEEANERAFLTPENIHPPILKPPKRPS
jgi:N-sulfoglucosamine sulfohydrolase